MLTLPIETEIETEHKVIHNLNMRQTILFGSVGVIAVASYAITRDLIIAAAISLPFALAAAYFSRKTSYGLDPEELILMKIKRFLYKNGSRKYRTKNRYFGLMNQAYRAMRNRDMADKAIAKKIKKKKKMAGKLKRIL